MTVLHFTLYLEPIVFSHQHVYLLDTCRRRRRKEQQQQQDEFCFIRPEFQTMHTLYPCQITQNQYKNKNHSKHGNNV